MSGLLTMILGPVTGLVGSLLGAGVKWLEHRQRMAELDRQQAHELRLQKLNIEARGQELEQEALNRADPGACGCDGGELSP